MDTRGQGVQICGRAGEKTHTLLLSVVHHLMLEGGGGREGGREGGRSISLLELYHMLIRSVVD